MTDPMTLATHIKKLRQRFGLRHLVLVGDHEAARASRSDAVAPKLPSPSAKRKACTKRTPDGLPVHSFQTLLKDLATITRNTTAPKLPGAPGWQQETEPTALQEKILRLLHAHPMSSQQQEFLNRR